jgi:phospholipase C
MQPALGQAYAVNQAAEDFVLCERWHASVPGPTWPNRFFLHCGTSGGVSISPDTLGSMAVVDYASGHGFEFRNRTIFHRLTDLGVPWRIYHSGSAQVWALQGLSPFWDMPSAIPLMYPVVRRILAAMVEGGAINIAAAVAAVLAEIGLASLSPFTWIEIARETVWLLDHLSVYLGTADVTEAGGLERDIGSFAADVSRADYLPYYTFIEPHQIGDVAAVNSGHPAYGPEDKSEDLLAEIYRALRASPMWQRGECALILVYDEHGGLYDHVAPPRDDRYNPQDRSDPPQNQYRSLRDPTRPEHYHELFDFSLLGLRVPAVVISPYTSQARAGRPPAVSRVIYDHASIVRTLQRRLNDHAWLSPRVAACADLFDMFGNTPLSPGDPQRAPKTLTRYRSTTPPPVPGVRDPGAPIPTSGSPGYGYHLDRAVEILARCGVSARGGAVAAVHGPSPSMQPRATPDPLPDLIAAERGRRRALRTLGDANGYLHEADTALAGYRGRVNQARAALARSWTTVRPKDRYAALRAALTGRA